MALSASSLFHFTRSLDVLKNILRYGAFPRYSKETLKFGLARYKLAIPMTCFCDIPLSQAKEHIKSYGEYGIGVSKDWGTHHGLNPILYVRSRSEVTRNLLRVLKEIETMRKKHPNNLGLRSIYLKYRYLLFYTKPYLGRARHNILQKIKLYDEREWRYVPKLPMANSYTDTTIFSSKRRLSVANKSLEHYALPVEHKYIRYIIVSKAAEIPGLIRSIKLNFKHLSQVDRDVLITKIITASQIKNDF